MKCPQIITVLLFITATSFANGIDSLQTEQDVFKFLREKIGQNGITYLRGFINIPTVATVHVRGVSVDSFPVVDPYTGATVIRGMQEEYERDCRCGQDSMQSSPNYPVGLAIDTISKYQYRFYKADIDGNGLTDLVIDGGIVIIAMDIGSRVEAHMFSESTEYNSYEFRNFVRLPDGSTALTLRHDHNWCWNDDGDVRDSTLYNMTDTIVYKYGGFARYNPRIKPPDISKIDYYFIKSRGFGNYDVACLEINKDGRCFLLCSNLDTAFTTLADTGKVNELFNLIDYADVVAKKDTRACLSGDGNGCAFAIYFNDGTVKTATFLAYYTLMDLGYLSFNIADMVKSLKWSAARMRTDLKCRSGLPFSNHESECDCPWIID